MPPAPRFRLVRLEAAHWRGIGDAVSIPLDQPLNIIYGPNGAGKSSLLTAIEWALFSREAQRITDHHIAERRGWETRYVHSREQPSVELELVSGGRKSSVLRAGRTPSTTPAVQASYADFKGLVFLHQETLRDFSSVRLRRARVRFSGCSARDGRRTRPRRLSRRAARSTWTRWIAPWTRWSANCTRGCLKRGVSWARLSLTPPPWDSRPRGKTR